MTKIVLAGCAILRDNKLVLIRKHDKDIWELPGGRSKEGEEEQTAVEKTANQIGVEPEIIQHFTMFEYQVDGTDVEAAIFEGHIPSETVFTPSKNTAEVAWFDIKDLPKDVGDDVKAIIEEYSQY